jgi:hypothetical protein
MSDRMIDVLVERIEGDKEKFIAELRAEIKKHVAAKNAAEVLKLVTKRGSYAVTWSIMDGVPYAVRLVSFIREKPYVEDGVAYEVDSAMTDEILGIVLNKLSAVVLVHSELIGDIALAKIMLHDATRNRFLDVLLKGNAVAQAAGEKGKAIVAGALMHGVQEKLHHLSASISSSVSEKAGHLLAVVVKSGIVTNSVAIAAKVAATAGGKVVLAKLSIVMAESVAPLVAKLLAMPVLQAALKKIVAVAVVGTIAKLVAAKVGMSVASAAMWLLIPIILGLLVKDIIKLPEKLGSSLADAVCGELRKTYTRSMNEIVVALLADFTSGGVVDEFAKALGNDLTITKELGGLIAAGLE